MLNVCKEKKLSMLISAKLYMEKWDSNNQHCVYTSKPLTIWHLTIGISNLSSIATWTGCNGKKLTSICLKPLWVSDQIWMALIFAPIRTQTYRWYQDLFVRLFQMHSLILLWRRLTCEISQRYPCLGKMKNKASLKSISVN